MQTIVLAIKRPDGLIPDKYFDSSSSLHNKAQEYADTEQKNLYIYIDRNCIICPTLCYFIYEDEFFRRNRIYLQIED